MAGGTQAGQGQAPGCEEGWGMGLGRPCCFSTGENAGGLVRVVAKQVERRGCILDSVILCPFGATVGLGLCRVTIDDE